MVRNNCENKVFPGPALEDLENWLENRPTFSVVVPEMERKERPRRLVCY